MKTIINSIKTVIVTIAAVFSLSFTTATIPNNDSTDKVEAQLNYVGKAENQPMFRLVFNNNDAHQIVVIVREASGTILFSEKLKTGTKARIYQLDADDSELISGTTFEVVNKTTKQSTVYKIKNYEVLTQTGVTIAKL